MIVYVHGALQSRRSFNYISCALKEESRSQHFFSYDIRKEHGAEIVQRLIGLMKSLAPQEPVTFISHSYGGVLAVDAVRGLDSRQYNVISMATPYGGSVEASFLKLLKPSSILLSNVGKYHSYMRTFSSKPLPCRVRGLVTTGGTAEWTTESNDGIVTVASQRHYEADPNWSGAFLNVNHFEVLMLPQAVKLIKNELES